MRGMIKWKPFNSLINNNDINNLIKEKSKISKPIILEDRINEINYTLTNAINNKLNVEIKYFNIMLKQITGVPEKVNLLEKYILINKTRIYFKDLINIRIL